MRPLSLAVVLLAAGSGVAQTAQLTPEALKKIKATTVYIRVKVPDGLATGSGFLVKRDGSTGWIATNDHVVAPSSGKSKADRGQPMQVHGVQVVFQSGTGKEWKVAGQVVARDPERDLACVRFTAPKGVELPEPMSPVGVKATETMPVYVCGFPFGEMLAEGDKNPEISIGPASVSSVRSDDRDEVKSVQINGALNPGNSGGPIVNADGKLVGVAVTTIKGAGLGFAVPQHMVKQMMDGRVSEPLLLRSQSGAAVALSLVVDPLGKVKLDKGWIAPVADPNKKALANVSDIKGAFSFPVVGRVVSPPNGEFRIATAEFPLAAGVTEAWVQSAWKDADGATKRGLAYRAHFLNVAGAVRFPGNDDDSPGSLPKEFFDGVPGLPAMPGGPGGGPFAGPGSPFGPPGAGPPGSPKAEGIGPRGGMTPRLNPNAPPAAPFGGPMPRPGRPSPGGPKGPQPPQMPGGPQEADTEPRSLELLDGIAANPARAVGRKYGLWLTVAGVSGTRLDAFRPDGTPLVGLAIQLDPGLAEMVKGDHARRGGGRQKAVVTFEISRYDAAGNQAVGQALGVVLDPSLTGGGPAAPGSEAPRPIGEEEESTPARPTAPPPSQPAMTEAPVRPPTDPPAGDGMSPTVIYIAVGLMLAAVLGVAGVGVAAMYAGKPVKKTKRRPARDWDDDEDDDDRPRRR